VPLAKYRNAQLQGDATLQSEQGSGSGSSTLAPQPPLLLPYSGQDQQLAARLMAQLLAREAGLSTQLLAALLRSPLASQLGGRQPGLAGLGPGLDLCAPNVTGASLQRLLADAAGPGGSSGGAGLGQASQQLSQLLSDLGAVLGTSAPTSPTSYLEPAFLAGAAALDTQSSSGAGASVLGSGSQARAAKEAAGREVGGRAVGCACGRMGRLTQAAALSWLAEWRLLAMEVHAHAGRCRHAACARFLAATHAPPPQRRPSAPVDQICLQLRPLYYVADNCSALAPADARVVAQLGCVLDALLGVPLHCASAQPQWEPDQQGLRQEIFCGWQAAACVATLDGQARAVQEVRLPAYQVGALVGTSLAPAWLRQRQVPWSSKPALLPNWQRHARAVRRCRVGWPDGVVLVWNSGVAAGSRCHRASLGRVQAASTRCWAAGGCSHPAVAQPAVRLAGHRQHVL
jgi:hypothetical protein